MSSIGSATSTSYVPPVRTDSATAPDSSTVPAQADVQTPDMDARPPALAPETASALLNEWAAGEGAGTRLDLSGQDLREVDLKSLDLRGANLTGANLSGMSLNGLDLSGADISGADLSNTTLANTNLAGVKADSANLASATFISTKVDGASFKQADFSGAYIGKYAADVAIADSGTAFETTNVKISNVDFEGANFSGATLKYATFDKVVMHRASFLGATFDRRAGIINSDVSDANFQGVKGEVRVVFSDLSRADFTKVDNAIIGITASKIDRVSFEGSSLSYLGIGDSDARTVNFNVKNKDFGRASFANVNLSGQDFSGFNFSKASIGTVYGAKGPDVTWSNGLEGTNFTNARFTGATIQGADFTGTNVSGASFVGARISRSNFSGLTTVNLTGVASIDTSKFHGTAQRNTDFGRSESIVASSFRVADLSQTEFGTVSLNGNDFNGAQLALGRLTAATGRDNVLGGKTFTDSGSAAALQVLENISGSNDGRMKVQDDDTNPSKGELLQWPESSAA